MFNQNELYHHGIQDQKWGIRRYQNPDGSLTPEGKERYSKASKKFYKKYGNKIDDFVKRREEIENSELVKSTKRMRLENENMREKQIRIENGEHFVRETLQTIGASAALVTGIAAAIYAIQRVSKGKKPN